MRKRKKSEEGGFNVWRSYSDMMAGVLLLFILIMCVTLFQAQKSYNESIKERDDKIALQEQYTAEILAQQSELDEKNSKLSSQDEQLDKQKKLLAELEAKRQQELQQQQQQEQQQESDKPSSGDGNSTVTPTPPTTPDSGGDIIQGGGSDATHDELTTFAALLDCEAIHDYNSMLAVATVIMNRVESPLFPNSIHGVIYATGQFEPVWSGRLDSVLNSGPSKIGRASCRERVSSPV